MTDDKAFQEASDPVQLATGYSFTEGPLWHPDGYLIFADVRNDKLYKLVPGQAPTLLRTTENGNGTAFDLDGRVIQCEGTPRRVTRWNMTTGEVDVIADGFEGKRLNRPNDVVCRSDGSLFFTDPDKRVPLGEREVETAAIYRVAPDGSVHRVVSCEYPNGLAFSADERRLYVANTRFLKYLHVMEIGAGGDLLSHRLFADMSWDDAPGSPDGVKVDAGGRVLCTGPGGIWVFDPAGAHLGTIRLPRPAVNFAFGGKDLRTLFVCAHESVFSVQMSVPGLPQPYYARHRG